MPFSIEFLETPRFVFIVAQGNLRYANYRKMVIAALKAGDDNNSRLYLGDFTQAINLMPMRDLFRLNRWLERFTQQQSIRVAFVVHQNQKDYELFRMFEISNNVRGCPIRLFNDTVSASRWLSFAKS